jgi:hypothetical protein
MSDYVVHLTKGVDARTAFYNILISGVISATAPSGIARDIAGMNQVAACFSEIPVREVDRLANRYSPYGLGFHHETLIRQGGARVWYVDLDRTVASNLVLLRDQHAQRIDPADPFWAVAPFIERPGVYGNGTRYQFEWEREWRVARSDMWFAGREIVFVFAPQEEHETLAGWLPRATVTYDHQVVSPLVLDPRWPDDQLFTAFARHMELTQ